MGTHFFSGGEGGVSVVGGGGVREGTEGEITISVGAGGEGVSLVVASRRTFNSNASVFNVTSAISVLAIASSKFRSSLKLIDTNYLSHNYL